MPRLPRFGVDFDNTIACYDRVFHRVATQSDLFHGEAPPSKGEIRDTLRAQGRESDWVALQGMVYGPGMPGAEPFPGVKPFIAACVAGRVPVFIISHRTRRPESGAEFDLHAAAREWLEHQGFFEASEVGLSPQAVHFELTRKSKLEKIAECRCTHFVDDLPEFLGEAGFPPATRKILFDPRRSKDTRGGVTRAASWAAIHEMLLPVGP